MRAAHGGGTGLGCPFSRDTVADLWGTSRPREGSDPSGHPEPTPPAAPLSWQGRERRFPSGHLGLGTPMLFKGTEPLPCPAPSVPPGHPPAGRARGSQAGEAEGGSRERRSRSPCAPQPPEQDARPGFVPHTPFPGTGRALCGSAAGSCRHGNRCSFLGFC